MTEKEIERTYALDEPTSRDYQFSEYELFNTNKENGTGELKSRPSNAKIWNQGNSPACTCYSACHVYNGENLLEDKRLGEDRPQQDPMPIWNQFNIAKWEHPNGTTIQNMAMFYKEKWMITGYVTISNGEKDIVAKMKRAIDMWMFMSCGSRNGDYTETKKTWIYTIRKDGKFVWHAWCIVDYWDGFFWCVNSYGENRWPYNWMFKLMFEDITKVYSKLVFIDKDDSWAYSKLRAYKKAQEMIAIAKELYMNANTQQKQYFEQIQLWNNIERLYKV